MGLSAISTFSHNAPEETKVDLPPPTIPELTAEERILQDWDECNAILAIFLN